jgi:actin-related protein 9
MFRGEQAQKWEPFKVRPKDSVTNGANGTANEEGQTNGASHTEPEYYEDQETEEGAVWPIKQGRIVNWGAFFGLFEYVYNRLSPGFHTPICLVGQPAWTLKDQQKITQYIFEKLRPPAFSIVDSALCSLFAHNNTPNACVVDIGYEKADVTAIVDFNVHTAGRQLAIPECGGDAFTERLFELLSKRKWSREMCEQLKKSTICEILPAGLPIPGSAKAGKEDAGNANPAAAASTGATASGPGHRDTAGALGEKPLGPGPGTQVGSEFKDDGDDEGVLDIAKIVGTGSTKDFIAQKEKEKSEKQAFKKGQRQDAAAQAQQAKNSKLLNRDRATASFIYSDYALLDALKNRNMSADDMARAHAAVDEGSKQTQAEKSAAAEQTSNTLDNEAPKAGAVSSLIHTKAPRREIEVGAERFQAATGGAIDRVADAVQRTISSVNEVAKRSELWDNLIVVGNGAKIRGNNLPSLHLSHCTCTYN